MSHMDLMEKNDRAFSDLERSDRAIKFFFSVYFRKLR